MSARIDVDKEKATQSNMTNKLVVLVVALALIIIGFIGGVVYQRDHKLTMANQRVTNGIGGSSVIGGFGRNFNGPRPFLGTVTAISSDKITIKNQNGSQEILGISSNTAITNNRQSAMFSDIKVGDIVVVRVSSTDSTKAASIILNPSFGGGPVTTPSMSTN